MPRHLSYFVSDVHLGLDVSDPEGREERFVALLRGIPQEETENLFLLGDIWDFWYEYRDVVPRGYARVIATLQDLVRSGVKVYFFRGNHDIWTFSYFGSLGIVMLEQPYCCRIGGKAFCMGHGDGLKPGWKGYRGVQAVFRSPFLQKCFSTLHPRIAFSLAGRWSLKSRLSKSSAYEFKGEGEPLWKFCASFPEKVDYFIFGHYHCLVDMPVGPGRLLVLGDWMSSSNWLVFDSATGEISRRVADPCTGPVY